MLALAGLVAWVVYFSPVFDSPERHVARYLGATGSGNGNGAMNEWDVYVSSTDPRFHAPDALLERRRTLSIELATNRVGKHFTIEKIDWWATCCTPRPIDDPKNSGLARVHVTTTGESGLTYRLIFEVWVKDLTWWGDAAGEWLHDWRLYEVHPEDEPCVFGGTAYGCTRPTG